MTIILAYVLSAIPFDVIIRKWIIPLAFIMPTFFKSCSFFLHWQYLKIVLRFPILMRFQTHQTCLSSIFLPFDNFHPFLMYLASRQMKQRNIGRMAGLREECRLIPHCVWKFNSVACVTYNFAYIGEYIILCILM